MRQGRFFLNEARGIVKEGKKICYFSNSRGGDVISPSTQVPP